MELMFQMVVKYIWGKIEDVAEVREQQSRASQKKKYNQNMYSIWQIFHQKTSFVLLFFSSFSLQYYHHRHYCHHHHHHHIDAIHRHQDGIIIEFSNENEYIRLNDNKRAKKMKENIGKMMGERLGVNDMLRGKIMNKCILPMFRFILFRNRDRPGCIQCVYLSFHISILASS